MTLLICPGVHSAELTQQFLAAIALPEPVYVFPTDQKAPYSPLEVLDFIQSTMQAVAQSRDTQTQSEGLRIVAFSAGVVGAIAAAHLWQLRGGTVRGVIALDGWGMPGWANFPVYRVSHDGFTHWSSGILGGASAGFYCDPAVPHLELWRSPNQATGWWTTSLGGVVLTRQRAIAAEFILHHLQIMTNSHP
ncbi:MAG: hypothetical protein AAFX78_13195 [Cyanobacteria bacterium J06638_20]